MENITNIEDGFYFIEHESKIISVIAVFNDKNEVAYIGDSNSDTIGQLVDYIKIGRIKLLDKIPLPK